MPAPTSISSSLIFKSLYSNFNVIPLIPLSFTSKLVPFPITVRGILLSFDKFIIYFNSFKSFTFIKISAGPPILKDVCLLISSSLNTLSFSIYFNN